MAEIRRELLKLFGITVGATILDQAARDTILSRKAQSVHQVPRTRYDVPAAINLGSIGEIVQIWIERRNLVIRCLGMREAIPSQA